MPRIARVVAIGVPHHITQAGNDKQQVLFDDAGRRMLLRLLGAHGEEEGVRLLGYCLMSNHTHYVAIPDRPRAFARWLGRTHLRYTQYFSLRYAHCGRLWLNRFYSCPMDNRHLAAALRYGDRNPVRAGMVAPGAAFEVRFGTAPGEDTADRVWTVRHGEPARAGRREAGELHVSGVHALLRDEFQRLFHHPRANGAQPPATD